VIRVVYALCLVSLGGAGCSGPSPSAAEPGHPLIGHWSVVSINGTALPGEGHVIITFRACGCSTVNAHGNLEVAKLYDASKINEAFRAYRGLAPAVGAEVRLAGEGSEMVVRRVDADAPACCQNRAGD
jgi:hypothetical protein